MKRVSFSLLLASLGGALAWRPFVPADTPVAYPEGYRSWVHVKSGLVSPSHQRYSSIGGFQHIYANPGRWSGTVPAGFPTGRSWCSTWLEMRDTAGAFEEGPRRQVDVMVKDSVRFAATGGWGFQRFVKDSRTELAATPTPQQCFTCHDKAQKGWARD
jgi:hypothetical protein